MERWADDGGRELVSQPRAGTVAEREGDEHAERERGGHDDDDQRAQVLGDRVAGLGADLLEVETLSLRDARDGDAVDRP